MVGRRKGRKEQKCNRGTLSFQMNMDQWQFQVLKGFIVLSLSVFIYCHVFPHWHSN